MTVFALWRTVSSGGTASSDAMIHDELRFDALNLRQVDRMHMQASFYHIWVL